MSRRRDPAHRQSRPRKEAQGSAGPEARVDNRARRVSWWQPVVLLLLVALAYANGLSGPFVYDDKLTVVENRQIRDLSSARSLLLPDRELPVAGRPVVNVSFAVNYALHGLEIRGYRIGNVGLHALCGLLFFGVARRTLVRMWGPEGARRATGAAFAAAALWLVHPLNSEAVSYLTQRTELMMAMWYLVVLYASSRAASTGHPAPWTALAIVACALGMGSKESMVTAPVMVLLVDRVFVYASVREAWRRRWPLYTGLAATWLVLAWLQATGPRIHSAGFATGVSVWSYLLNQTVMIVRYLRLAIWPDALVLNYGVPQGLTLAQTWPAGLVIVALLALSAVALVRRPPLGFLGAWFFVTLAPTSSLVPIATEVGAERRMYLPLMAVVLLAVIGAVRAGAWWAARRGAGARQGGRPARMAGGVALMLLVLALAAATMRRNTEYQSALTLAQTSFARWPTPVAHHMVATELSLAGREEDSLRELRQSVKGYPRGHYDLGIALFRKREFAAAIAAFNEFVARFPSLLEVVEARVLTGRALMELQRFPEAVTALEDGLRMHPSRHDVHGLLADALVRAERPADAIPHYRQFLTVYPRDPGALSSLGVLLVEREELPEAVELFRRAIDVDPANPGTQRNLAGALLGTEDVQGAIVHARQAVALRPEDPLALDLLGVALATDGRAGEAIGAFQRARALAPDDPEIRAHLEAALTLVPRRPPEAR